MPKRIYQSELCNFCAVKSLCNSENCTEYMKLDECICDELQERIDNAFKFAEDAGIPEVIEALNGKLKYPQKGEMK